MKSSIVLIAAAACAVVDGAAAQDRVGLPPVQSGPERGGLPPVQIAPPSTDPAAAANRAFADFRAWNAAHSHPPMLIFWNRELTDETTTRYRDRVVGGSGTISVPGAAAREFEIVSERERTTGGRAVPLVGLSATELESAYLASLIGAGAQLLDRNALMRKVSTRQNPDDRSDQQFLEAVALEQGVQYLIEVLPEPSLASPTGLNFSVKITHLPTARVHAQFLTKAIPVAGPARLVAAQGGFQRRRDSRNTPSNVGAQLAAETMGRFF